MEGEELREFAKDICSCGIALSGLDYKYGVNGDSHFDRLAIALADKGYQKVSGGKAALTKEDPECKKREKEQITKDVAYAIFHDYEDKLREKYSIFDIIDAYTALMELREVCKKYTGVEQK